MTAWTVPGIVKRVVDADTYVCDLDLGWHMWLVGAKVRLARVNAPEIDTNAGKQSKAAVEAMLNATAGVTVTSHSLDKYGRILGDVRVEAIDGPYDLAQRLLDMKLAEPYE